MYPERFNNKTNGITHRRWLIKANTDLADLLVDTIGDEWVENPLQIKKLMNFIDDKKVLERLGNIKYKRKAEVVAFVKKLCCPRNNSRFYL